MKTFASSEGAYVEQDLVETGCGIEATAVDEGEVQRRSYPNSFGGQHAARGLGDRRRVRPRRQRPARRRRGRGPAHGEALPARHHHRHPRRLAGRPAGARELRPRHRARPRPRHRGGVRRHELPHRRQPRRAALRLRRRQPDRGRHHPRRPRQLRLRRRGRAGPAHAGGARRPLPRLPHLARDGAPAPAAPPRPRSRRIRSWSTAAATARCAPPAGTASPSSA